MSTFTTGDTLFVTSSSPDRKSLAEQVMELVDAASKTLSVAPVLTTFLSEPQDRAMFFNVFAHHVEILKSRSQSFEDGQVTVYDKTLLALARNGDDLESPAAIEYFCEKFLGIALYGDTVAEHHKLMQSLVLPTLLAEGNGS